MHLLVLGYVLRLRNNCVVIIILLLVGWGTVYAQFDSPYYVALLVDAKQLNYTNFQTLLDSVIHDKKNNPHHYVGHAWIILCGEIDGKKIVVEGGHSGEIGRDFPCYLDGLVLHSQLTSLYEPNPIRYLHTTLYDGFFQSGPGVHTPTFAVILPISKEQFKNIYAAIHPERYDFSSYSLTTNQCVTFVAKVACLAGLTLEYEVTVDVPSSCNIQGREIPLWKDPNYKQITIPSPDILEKSLKKAVEEKKALLALEWYQKEFSR